MASCQHPNPLRQRSVIQWSPPRVEAGKFMELQHGPSHDKAAACVWFCFVIFPSGFANVSVATVVLKNGRVSKRENVAIESKFGSRRVMQKSGDNKAANCRDCPPPTRHYTEDRAELAAAFPSAKLPRSRNFL